MNAKFVSAGAVAALVLSAAMAPGLYAQTTATGPDLTPAEVIEIALAEIPGEVQEMELETEDGLRVWEVEILTAENTEMEVEIDAQTGDILDIEAEDDDDDDKDDDD